MQPTNTTIPPQELAKLPDDARKVIESTPLENIVCRFSYDIDPLPKIYDGRVILIGDAAHAKSSTRARGMTSGWEDGLYLTKHLAESANIPEALEKFQTERLPIVHEYQRTSREMSLKIGRR
nr:MULTISPECIES: FAD-dependent monooxygenase [unclassified Tychonema]